MRTKTKVAKGPVKQAAGAVQSLDRATFSSTQLYRAAAREKTQLSQDEKDRVSPDYLFVLAITNRLGLSQRDKDRLRPLHLSHLAVMQKIDLTQADKARLPTDLLFQSRAITKIAPYAIRLQPQPSLASPVRV